MRLILYSKPGCHLCESLQEKLQQIIKKQKFASLQLEIRDITTRQDWFNTYQLTVPVMFAAKCSPDTQLDSEKMQLIPRPSPRVTVQQLEKILQKYL